LLLFLVININAQITIDGTITDSELNPISAALVEIIDQNDTSNYYSSVTNESGYFAVSNITDIRSKKTNLPSEFIVLRSYPNPFNPTTIIYYELPKSENIEIKIYDILGRKVRTLFNDFHKAGTYTLNWDGRNSWNSPVAAGIYFCRLKTKDQFKVHKMVLLDGGSTFSSVSNNKLKSTISNSISKINGTFNFSIKISGNSILETDFKYLICSGDTTLNLMVPKILQIETIGPEGGKLENEDFSLIVPEGAFNDHYDIQLSIDPNDNSFIDNSSSLTFLIDGIPDDINKNLLIGIKLSTITSDTLYSAIGQLGYNWASGEMDNYYNFEPVRDSLDYYYCTISPKIINSSRFNCLLNKSNGYYPKAINIRLVTGYEFMDDAIYIYIYPKKNKDEINVFRTLLIEIPIVFNAIGFTKERFDGWGIFSPVEIVIKYLPSSFIKPLRYGSMLSHSLIQINEEYFVGSLLPEIRREFGHLYYYRYFFNEKFDEHLTYTEGIKNWLNHDPYLRVLHHAIATWCEETFEPISENYVPHCFNGNEMQIFKGLVAGVDFNLIITNEFQHGYGLAALIKYLMNEYGTNLLFKFYSKVLSNEKSADALLESIKESPSIGTGNYVEENIWWPNFFKEFIQGNIYNVPSEEFLKNITETIEFNDGDTLKYADETYYDLSAKLFKIKINSDDIKNNKSLNFKIGQESLNLDYVKALVFGIRNSNLVFISEGIDFSLGNLYQFDGLLACVVNSGNEQPYTGTSEIQLDIRAKEELQFNACKIEVGAMGIWERHRIPAPPNTSPTIDTMDYRAEWNTIGNFTGNTFEGVLEPSNFGAEATGTIKLVLDDQLNILSFNVAAKSQYGDHEYTQWECAGVNIALQSKTDWNMYFDVLSKNTCNNLTKLYQYSESPPSNTGIIPYSKLIDYFCDENSFIKVTFYKKSLP
jgi:hypothetical protein